MRATPARKPGNSIIPGKLYIWLTVCVRTVLYGKPAWSRAYDKGKCNVKFKKGKMKRRVGFRRRQEFMKPSHFFIPTGSVSDPYWIRIQK